MKRRVFAGLSIGLRLGTAIGLSGCATIAATRNVPTFEGLIPQTLPDPSDDLGFLRPDAGPPIRNDVSISLKPYIVSGSTAEAILDGEDGILSELSHQGRSFVARVDWVVKWAYEYDKGDETACRVETVQTDLDVTYTLPDWQPAESPDPGLREYWMQFEEALWTHEYGHALIGYRTKQDIQAALSESDLSNESCAALGRELNQIARGLIARGHDAAYDAKTDHGATQGAIFKVEDAQKAIADTPTGMSETETETETEAETKTGTGTGTGDEA